MKLSQHLALGTAIGVGLFTLPAWSANTQSVRSTTTEVCLMLPPINENHIYNSKTGDQSDPRDRHQEFLYEYAYKAKSKAELTLMQEHPNHSFKSKTVYITNNKTRRFRGARLEHVKNLAQKWVESRDFLRCPK